MINLVNEIRLRCGYQRDYSNIDNNFRLWLNCYHGEPFWLDTKVNKESLNLCSSIPSELARLVTLELETSVSNEQLDEIYQRIIRKIRTITEYGLALGGVILKPYLKNKQIEVDVTTPDMYVILGFNSFGDVKHIAFIDRLRKVEKDRYVYYTRLEEHLIKDKYFIRNTAYKSFDVTQLGTQIALNSVEQWATLKEQEVINRKDPLFAYFKNPQANNLDLRSQEGISCFAKAISLIQDADEQYQRTIWEYKGSELAIDADITVLKNTDELPVGKERLFRNLGSQVKDDFYNVFSPAIRDVSLFNGLNEILRQIEFICGLAYGTFSKNTETEKTATEIKASKQRSFSTVKDIQNELERTLRQFVEILSYWLKISEKYDINFDFDDSLVIDSETERTVKLQEVATGIITKERYLQEVYGLEDTTEWIPQESKVKDVLEEE